MFIQNQKHSVYDKGICFDIFTRLYLIRRILLNIIFDNLIFSLQPYGGISVYWQELVSRFLLDTPHAQLHTYPNRNKSAVPLFDTTFKINHRLPAQLALFTDFKTQINEPHIYHASYYRSASHPLAKKVITVHDLILDQFGTSPLKKLKLYPKQKSIIQADAIICVSNNTKIDVLQLYDIPEERIHVIYNGASTHFFPLDDDTSIKPKKQLLYIGARSFYKRFDWFANLINTLSPKFEALIIGGGPMSTQEQSLFKTKPTFFEHVDINTLNTFYNKAFAMIYPSSYEGFGIPLVEAAQANCPILCFNNSCIPEILGENHPLYINEQDSTEHAIQLLNQLENDSFKTKAIYSQTQSTKNFNWENTYQQTKELYKSLLST